LTIHLVGAGPGDPELLTVRAARLLAAADVVVHDALVGDGVLALVNSQAELIDVGKRPGRGVPQELICALLVTLAESGRTIVRLKGGDPFVFGRGGEEAQALLDAGIAFEVVPGVTSVVTGHRRTGEPDVDWRSLARVGGTIVVLMGVTQRGHIAAELLAGGLAGDTPVAAVHSATTVDQVTMRCRLDELGASALESPAVIVIGPVAAFELLGVGSADGAGRSDVDPSGLHGVTSLAASANSSTVSTRVAIPSA
jgi:siroheme synthase